MENTARITGYALALAILGTLLALVLFLKDGSVFRSNEVRVAFPAIGTLMQDDPVRLHGVEVGRVDRIEGSDQGPVATLELFHRQALPRDTRFVNYNYSLFGARMVLLVPGSAPEPLDASIVHAGEFSNGVAETIHRVEDLLRTVVEYENLSNRLERGDGGNPSLSELLSKRIYPALEDFGRFAHTLEQLQDRASGDLEDAASYSDKISRASNLVARHTDTMVVRAGRTVEKVALLTAQSQALLESLEKMLLAAADTNRPAGKMLMSRDLYDRTMSLTHALQDLLKLAKSEGLEDVIHFWRNVRIHWKPAKKP